MEKNFKLLKTPEEAYNLLLEITSIDIYKKTRVRLIVEHRAFFCYILRTKFKMTYEGIAKHLSEYSEIKSYNHATAINACNQFIVYKKSEAEYYDILQSHFNVSSKFEYSQLSKLVGIQKSFIELEQEHVIALNTIKEYETERFDGYTKNEIQYRKLNEEEKQQYDERAEMVLKSFNWKKPQNKYEVITCAS